MPLVFPESDDIKRSDLDPLTYLGAAGVFLMMAEIDESWSADVVDGTTSQLGPFSDLCAYVERRQGKPGGPLPELPVPDEFKQLFRDWAEGKVDFTAPN